MRINWLGVIVSAIIIVALRYLWYAHFGGADWGRLLGSSFGQVQADHRQALYELVNALVLCAALGWVIGRLRDRVLSTGIGVGILACVGFALTTASDGFIHGGPMKNAMVDGGYLLVAYVIAGAILGVMAPKRSVSG